jgi:hypothetical protein
MLKQFGTHSPVRNLTRHRKLNMPRYPSSQGGDKKSKETWATKRPMLPESELPVLPEELCVGSMVWLRQRFPNEDDITCIREGHCTGFILREAGYMHPVVILKIWQRPGSEQPGDLMLAVSEVSSVVVSCFLFFNHFLFSSFMNR